MHTNAHEFISTNENSSESFFSGFNKFLYGILQKKLFNLPGAKQNSIIKRESYKKINIFNVPNHDARQD